MIATKKCDPDKLTQYDREKRRKYLARERERNKARYISRKDTSLRKIAGSGGIASRRRREEEIAETTVVRRCQETGCGQLYESKVKDEECPWCQG